jgi:hypothetical protein
VRAAGAVRKQRNPRLTLNLKLNDYKTLEADPPKMFEKIVFYIIISQNNDNS